jgi:glucokinase
MIDKKQTTGGNENDVVVAVDLGGTNLRAGLIDSSGRVLERLKHETPENPTAADILASIVKGARELALRVESGSVKAISVVVPGAVRAGTGIIDKAPNLPMLGGFDLGKALEAELGWKAIIENDANAAALGEMWMGAGRGCGTIICVTLGTGVGGGIVLDRKLWRGVDGAAGEIGHIGVEPSGVPCPCGSIGCLEVYSSATAISRMANELKATDMSSSLHQYSDVTSEQVYEEGLKGDAVALKVFERMGFYLGVGLASLVNVINPERLVLAGGAAAGWDLFYPIVRAGIDKRAFPGPARTVKVVRAEKGDDAGLLGAAWLGFDMEKVSS